MGEAENGGPTVHVNGVEVDGEPLPPCSCLWEQWKETDADGIGWTVNDPVMGDPWCELHPKGLAQ